MSIDDQYMQRCLQLARKGEGFTAPNPMVGCVIVCGNKIIGEGWHRKYGEAHAEVNAINSVKNKKILSEAVLYVSLEPCSHYGKTPPCTALIIEHGIPKVVVATVDPNPQVSGKGIEILRNAGVEVVSGVLEQEAKALNRIFFINQIQKRPYVILKWAQSADGFIDRKREINDGMQPAKFSNELSAIVVHRLRTHVQAIMVGTNTALLDNPQLTARYWYGENPVNVVIDKTGKLPLTAAIFNSDSRVIVFTQTENYKITKENIVVVNIDFQADVNDQILKKLFELKLSSILVEGGAALLNSFIEKSLWDEAFIEVSPLKLVSGIRAPAIDFKSPDYKTFHNNIRFHLKNATTQKFI